MLVDTSFVLPAAFVDADLAHVSLIGAMGES
jgi:hypothetical protein